MDLFYLIAAIFFFCLAAIFNAAMDTIRHHWNINLFGYINRRQPFWYKWWRSNWEDSYNEKGRKKFIAKYLSPFSDGWHFCKAGMLYCFIMAILFFPFISTVLFTQVMVYFLVIWFLVFEIFYNFIFVNRKYLHSNG